MTNQKQSGRCWMFAALNVLRFGVVKKYNLESFEFSQNYTLFYDKLEKANYFLENVIETYEEPADSRLLQHLIGAATQDGGQWDMICNIITKYGVVPKDAMPETACSSATAEMDFLLLTKLQEDAMLLRRAMRSGRTARQFRRRRTRCWRISIRFSPYRSESRPKPLISRRATRTKSLSASGI